MVLSVDEKTQIQSLNRTQPMLPLRGGLPARQTHEYKRNGLTSLYAALEVASVSAVMQNSPLLVIEKSPPAARGGMRWTKFMTVRPWSPRGWPSGRKPWSRKTVAGQGLSTDAAHGQLLDLFGVEDLTLVSKFDATAMIDRLLHEPPAEGRPNGGAAHA